MATNKELISSEQFEEALAEGSEKKKEIVTSCKQANKSTFQQFSETMFLANKNVMDILAKRRKDRTDAEVEEVKNFKMQVRQLYFQTQKLVAPEKLEAGKKSKFQKIVEKIVPVIDMLRYIDENALENELNKHGIEVSRRPKLEETYPDLADEKKKEAVKGIFDDAKSIQKRIDDSNEAIGTSIYTQKVPVELQFDKDSNNSGLKVGDFKRLVDIKMKLDLAKSQEAKDKVDEKIQDQAEEKQFEIARAELVRDCLSTLQ